jgi:predicted nucleic acid-binding protein
VAYLLDTDRLIEYLAQRPEAVSLVSQIIDEGLGISIITYAEFYEGIALDHNRDPHVRSLEDFVAGGRIYGIDVHVAQIFGNLRADLRRQGNLIDNFDLLIAATALRNDLTLVTRNRRDFERIEGLRLYPVPS